MPEYIPILPTISTFFILASGIAVAIGWWQISKRKFQQHEKTMMVAGVLALIFFITYLSRTILIGNTQFGGPDGIKLFYTVFLVFHIILATIGGVLGLFSLFSGYKKRMERHRKLGPLTSIVWFGTTVTGVTVYFLLYWMFPGGETTSVFRAILGY
ncbi:DUF420 domain-containing protein [Mangrovibacillus cuniculi]|uniref:DUF420 domain-containing protein n=1 Tax=Mangrovibacillus cuniculi TaxID=2593652 RepID=A0A7S8HFA1_9BACI|nr:DUF420 domain-containing protein [Mangrovibacillus cuniculi]QPC46220.1 DUF420 domain-containing protein [Mangrovibacillus cuniculi]